jgi:outer membrane protein assembly factor BamD (BamD/ComL family)
MSFTRILLIIACTLTPLHAQESTGGPTNEKAQKTYQEALQLLHERRIDWAIDAFKKADKQDGGHCQDCQRKIIKYALEMRDWKAAEMAAAEIVAEAQATKMRRSRTSNWLRFSSTRA